MDNRETVFKKLCRLAASGRPEKFLPKNIEKNILDQLLSEINSANESIYTTESSHTLMKSINLLENTIYKKSDDDSLLCTLKKIDKFYENEDIIAPVNIMIALLGIGYVGRNLKPEDSIFGSVEYEMTARLQKYTGGLIFEHIQRGLPEYMRY